MIPIFIGYDPRESAAFAVCANSIIRNSSEPVSITPLALGNLGHIYQEFHGDGSNQFIYTRFLVPYLKGYNGHAIYLDGDMVVRGDIAELWAMRSDFKAAQVVKHDYQTKQDKKYLGAKNENYPRKNWSSVILWNCGHYVNREMTPDRIMSMTGAELHRFTWIADGRLGTLPKEWNWLETEYEPNPDAKLIHYTLGAPCFADYADTPQAHYWHEEAMRTMNAIGEPPASIMKRAERRRRVPTKESER